MKQYPLLAVADNLKEFYDLTLLEDTLITYCLAALKHIGNKNILLKAVKMFPKKDKKGGFYVDRLCDMDSIEAITIPWFEPALETSSTDNYIMYKSEDIERWIEAFKTNKDSFYIPGKFVKYDELGDRIYFPNFTPEVLILYKSEYKDEDDLPYISEIELMALTEYCVFAWENRQGHAKKDADMLKLSQVAYERWQKLCSKARVAEGFSQNEVSEILDILTSADFHNYNISSTKPIK